MFHTKCLIEAHYITLQYRDMKNIFKFHEIKKNPRSYFQSLSLQSSNLDKCFMKAYHVSEELGILCSRYKLSFVKIITITDHLQAPLCD